MNSAVAASAANATAGKPTRSREVAIAQSWAVILERCVDAHHIEAAVVFVNGSLEAPCPAVVHDDRRAACLLDRAPVVTREKRVSEQSRGERDQQADHQNLIADH